MTQFHKWMERQKSRSSAVGLEGLCDRPVKDWCRSWSVGDGVELLEAWFAGRAYDTHRHDTYAIGITDIGVQKFDYRGEAVASTPGQVVVLHPDEPHDGRAGDERGFGYRIIYVCPNRIFEAVAALCGKARPLPFVPRAVRSNATIAHTIVEAFAYEAAPLACDALTLELARGLLEEVLGRPVAAPMPSLDMAALDRAQQFLDGELHRRVSSEELEAVTGLSRYECARQFRVRYGTSPYRYSLLRRLDAVRSELRQGSSIADLAARFGFADQAHLTRHFHAASGVTPSRYRRLHSSAARRS